MAIPTPPVGLLEIAAGAEKEAPCGFERLNQKPAGLQPPSASQTTSASPAESTAMYAVAPEPQSGQDTVMMLTGVEKLFPPSLERLRLN